jgi:predicted dinucleotide-binding enzyme
MSKKVAILGTGVVGLSLANGFVRNEYFVNFGTSNPSKITEWIDLHQDISKALSFEDAIKESEIVVLAVPGKSAIEIVTQYKDILAGKTVIDPTNPISTNPPVNGVLNFFTDINHSLMEQLQEIAPAANFVKAFSCVGSYFMVEPKFPDGKPTMFICGNNQEAKATVKVILDEFGWDCADMGSVESARAIEPLCMLWCIPGLQSNSWSHAFRLLKM